MEQRDPVYRELQRHLDRMPVPFPETSSGIELSILSRLFTKQEAEVALALSAIPEPVGAIFRRLRERMSQAELELMLERMAEKGLVQSASTKKGPAYGNLPLVLGMYEFQVDRLTAELERDVRQYLAEALVPSAIRSDLTQQMRTVPVHEAIDMACPVAPYEDIRKYVRDSEGPFAAIHCICRQGKDLTNEPCRQTSERRNCLMIGPAAAALTDKGIAVSLSKEEMLGLLDRADREGLVLQPQNTQNPMFVCCCCGCCCGILTNARNLRRPADAFQTAFVAQVDPENCEICGTCFTRCQMDAITDSGDVPVIDEGHCIGCGLCVTTCPNGAMKLRPLQARRPVPADAKALYSRMYQERFGRAAMLVALARHATGRQV